MAMIARSPIEGLEQNTTCSWPISCMRSKGMTKHKISEDPRNVYDTRQFLVEKRCLGSEIEIFFAFNSINPSLFHFERMRITVSDLAPTKDAISSRDKGSSTGLPAEPFVKSSKK